MLEKQYYQLYGTSDHQKQKVYPSFIVAYKVELDSWLIEHQMTAL